MSKRQISLIVKGPVKSAKRAAARHGINVSSCRAVGGRFADVQCYAPCTLSTNRKVVDWYTARARSKSGRGFPPGTLLYHGEMCAPGSERGASMLRGPKKPKRKRGLGNADQTYRAYCASVHSTKGAIQRCVDELRAGHRKR